MCFHKNFANVLRTPVLWNIGRLLLLKHVLKIEIAAPNEFLEAAVRRYFSKLALITGKHQCWGLFLIKLHP